MLNGALKTSTKNRKNESVQKRSLSDQREFERFNENFERFSLGSPPVQLSGPCLLILLGDQKNVKNALKFYSHLSETKKAGRILNLLLIFILLLQLDH